MSTRRNFTVAVAPIGARVRYRSTPMPRPRVFTIPGLGFTPDLFGRLDLGGYEVTHLAWSEPSRRQPLADYVRALAEPIAAAGPSGVAILGHSFGGVVAQEIAAQVPVAKLILISSVRERVEMPLWLRLARPLGLPWWIRKSILLGTLELWGAHYGYGAREDRDLVRRMISTQSDRALSWSLRALSMWRGADATAAEIHQIHGDRDRTLPFARQRHRDVVIEGGTHFLVWQRADEVTEHVRRWLGA